MNLFTLPLIKGYTTSVSLIIALGPQNIFILKHGLLKSHIFVVAILASITDIIMIAFGVNGIGFIVQSNYYLLLTVQYISILFLFFYGCKSFYLAFFSKSSALEKNNIESKSIKTTLIAFFAITLLNPQTYIDTMLLIGAVGAKLPEEQKMSYIIGAGMASISWFFCLSYGSRMLAPFFQKPISWKLLNILSGTIMWSISCTIFFDII